MSQKLVSFRRFVILILVGFFYCSTGFSSSTNSTEAEIYLSQKIGEIITELYQDMNKFSEAPFDTDQALIQVKDSFIKKIEILDYLIGQSQDENLIEESQLKKDSLLVEAQSKNQISTEGWIDETFALLTPDEMIAHMSNKNIGKAIVAIQVLEQAAIPYRGHHLGPIEMTPLELLAMAFESYDDENNLKKAAAASKIAIQLVSEISSPIVDVAALKEKHNQLIKDCRIKEVIEESTIK